MAAGLACPRRQFGSRMARSDQHHSMECTTTVLMPQSDGAHSISIVSEHPCRLVHARLDSCGTDEAANSRQRMRACMLYSERGMQAVSRKETVR